MKKYRFIDAQKAYYRINMLCRILDVPQSSYFDWNRTGRAYAALKQKEDDEIFQEITKIYDESKSTYGAPRIHEELRDGGVVISKKKVARIMGDNELAAVTNREHKIATTTAGEKRYTPDLVNREFLQSTPDVVWYGDITYIWVNDCFWYLATVIDACTKQVVGWRFADHMETSLVEDALVSAVRRRGVDYCRGVIFHSDRGSQYTSCQFAKTCKKLGVKQSMGRTGVCYDNAAAESFFSTIKRELVNRYWYDTAAELHTEIFGWIEAWYNAKRRHSAIGYKSPNQEYKAKKNKKKPTTV